MLKRSSPAYPAAERLPAPGAAHIFYRYFPSAVASGPVSQGFCVLRPQARGEAADSPVPSASALGNTTEKCRRVPPPGALAVSVGDKPREKVLLGNGKHMWAFRAIRAKTLSEACAPGAIAGVIPEGSSSKELPALGTARSEGCRLAGPDRQRPGADGKSETEDRIVSPVTR